jgi:hypothetical protein
MAYLGPLQLKGGMIEVVALLVQENVPASKMAGLNK